MVAEDGTIKKYCVEITRLSAKIAELSNLDLEGDIQLYPAFCSKIYEYSCEYRLRMNNDSEKQNILHISLLFLIFVAVHVNYFSAGIVPFHCSAVTLLPKVLDKNIKVTVNVEDSSQVPLNFGDTVVEISVCSADGSNSQVGWDMRSWLLMWFKALCVFYHLYLRLMHTFCCSVFLIMF